MQKTNKEIAESLRDIADWIEKVKLTPESIEFHPHTPEKVCIQFPCVNTREEFKQFATLSKKAVKEFDDTWFRMFLIFDKFKARAFQLRTQLCTKRVVGTRHVEGELIPERYIPAHDEEIVEWDCDPILEDLEKADFETHKIESGNL